MDGNMVELYAFNTIQKNIIENERILFNVINEGEVPIDIYVFDMLEPTLYSKVMPQFTGTFYANEPSSNVDKFQEYCAQVVYEESIKLDRLIQLASPTEVLPKANEQIVEKVCNLINTRSYGVNCIELFELGVYPGTMGGIGCNNTTILTTFYKLFIFAKYANKKSKVITLPQDQGISFSFGQDVSFPIEYKNSGIRKKLDIDYDSMTFRLEIEMPIKGCMERKSYSCDKVDGPYVNHVRVDTQVLMQNEQQAGTPVLLTAWADIGYRLGNMIDIYIEEALP